MCVCVYIHRHIYVWSVQKVSSHVIWEIETFIEEDTRNIVQRTMMPQSLKVVTLGPHKVLPVAISCPIGYSWISSMMILVWGRARSQRAPNLCCRGSWVTWVIWCFTKKPCMRHDAWVGTLLLWWSCQSPVAHNCGLLNYPNSFHGGMFRTKM